MAPLVTYPELCDYLGVPYGTDQQSLEPLLAETIALFEKACGRDRAPFGAAQPGRTEILRADPYSVLLTLDYPIETVTSIAIGQDVTVPDETLAPGNAGVVVWHAGGRDLIRTDGGLWARTAPRWVKVIYDAQADQPGDAKLAVKRMVATVYQARGKEGFTQITRGSRSWSMADLAGDNPDPFWAQAVSNHRRGWLR